MSAPRIARMGGGLIIHGPVFGGAPLEIAAPRACRRFARRPCDERSARRRMGGGLIIHGPVFGGAPLEIAAPLAATEAATP